jgi:hypothetical protein
MQSAMLGKCTDSNLDCEQIVGSIGRAGGDLMSPLSCIQNSNVLPQESDGVPVTDPSDSEDARLDAELVDTFPASDPIPWRHGA